MPPNNMVDIAIIGAGIAGLAHAYHAAKRGLSVVLFERSPRAMGASVRNFGLIWPIGQPPGRMRRIAMRSRAIWKEVLQSAPLWHAPLGSLQLAYHEDEYAVLREFAAQAPELGYEVALLDAEGVQQRCPSVRQEGLHGGLYSPSEITVDPREIVASLPGWLERQYGVTLRFNTAVQHIALPTIEAGGQQWQAQYAIVCSGDDFQTLYPQVFADSGLTRCKLQMMRTSAYGDAWQIGPSLAAGLTLCHYANYQACESLAAVRARFAAEMPEYVQHGIHVLVAQNGRGEVTLGDSHEYGLDVPPFDQPRIDTLVLDYLATFLETPKLEIAQRWHGVYAKHPEKPVFVARPAGGVTIVTGLGGAGMTLSFGVAEEVVGEMLAD